MAAIPDDPETTAYKAVREHELMLNEAVSRFEHARLAPLIVLNGGAVVAFLTLLGALLGKDSGSHPNLWLSGLAAGAWVGGLLAAALAVAAATKQQQDISAAHRLLREGLEDVLLGDKQRSPAERVAGLLRGPVPSTSPPSRQPAPERFKKWVCAGWHGAKRWWGENGTGENGTAAPPAEWPTDDIKRQKERNDLRHELRATAAQHGQRFKARWALGVTMFVTGAALALAAIVLDSASASDRRELRAVLNESAQHLVALSAPPKAEEIRQLERDNLRLVLRLGSANRVIEAHDDAVEAADTWEATPNSDAAEKDFGRQWDLFISEANKFARTEF